MSSVAANAGVISNSTVQLRIVHGSSVAPAAGTSTPSDPVYITEDYVWV